MDKEFITYRDSQDSYVNFVKKFSSKEISRRVEKIAYQIASDVHKGLRINTFEQTMMQFECIHLICVLKGSFRFTHDLMKALKSLTHTPIKIDFIQASSYSGEMTRSTQTSTKIIGDTNINFQPKSFIVLVEDIVDTGQTIIDVYQKVSKLTNQNTVMWEYPVSQPVIEVATLIHKPRGALKSSLPIRYVGMQIPNSMFVVGYGLDYKEWGRDLDCIYNTI